MNKKYIYIFILIILLGFSWGCSNKNLEEKDSNKEEKQEQSQENQACLSATELVYEDYQSNYSTTMKEPIYCMDSQTMYSVYFKDTNNVIFSYNVLNNKAMKISDTNGLKELEQKEKNNSLSNLESSQLSAKRALVDLYNKLEKNYNSTSSYMYKYNLSDLT